MHGSSRYRNMITECGIVNNAIYNFNETHFAMGRIAFCSSQFFPEQRSLISHSSYSRIAVDGSPPLRPSPVMAMC